jgi:predicted transcriptional regulator
VAGNEDGANMNNDKQIQNAQPVVKLMNALHEAEEATEDIINRDVEHGLYQLKAGPRKEQVKLLADQGLSQRDIAKVLGVPKSTVHDDLSAQNRAPIAQNRAPELDSKEEQHKEEIKELEDKLKKANEKHKRDSEKHRKEVEQYQEQILSLQEGPPPSNFERQVDAITGPLVDFIQHDNLVRMLSDLEIIKEDILDEFDMPQLERVIYGLISLARRAQSWSERLRPMNDKWKYRTRKLFEKELEL